jgi:pimeloyl-ACP methyl ester carboxylesterase
VKEPETRYAKSGGIHVAYQVSGEGPFDVVFIPGFVSHVEIGTGHSGGPAFLKRLESFSRLIRFDKRGTGMSDRVGRAPTLEARMDDVRAVMDAVGSRRAAFYGISEAGAMCLLFAATYPERTAALVTRSAYPRRMWAPDYPLGTDRTRTFLRGETLFAPCPHITFILRAPSEDAAALTGTTLFRGPRQDMWEVQTEDARRPRTRIF